MEKKSRAVILNCVDIGEADRLVTFFTEDFGKLRGVAKHAKRSKKRFGGGLECGSSGTIGFVERSGVELVRIDEFVVENPAWKMTASLDRIMMLHIALEVAERTLPLSHASRERFGLLSRLIAFLSGNEPSPVHRHAFFYKWLAASGLEPAFDRCVVCGKDVPNGDGSCYIESRHGGVVCRGCHRATKDFVELDNKALNYMQGFSLGRMSAKSETNSDKAFEYLLTHAIGGELRSLSVSSKLNI